MYKKILVPLDGSPLAEAVLPHAEELAKAEGAEIIILSVPILHATEFIAHDPIIAQQVVESIEQQTKTYVNKIVEMLKKDEIKATGITKNGHVPETILDVAEEIHADIIAMSTHGRTGIQRWLMGSVADKIIHHVRIPVMLIHPN